METRNNLRKKLENGEKILVNNQEELDATSVLIQSLGYEWSDFYCPLIHGNFGPKIGVTKGKIHCWGTTSDYETSSLYSFLASAARRSVEVKVNEAYNVEVYKDKLIIRCIRPEMVAGDIKNGVEIKKEEFEKLLAAPKGYDSLKEFIEKEKGNFSIYFADRQQFDVLFSFFQVLGFKPGFDANDSDYNYALKNNTIKVTDKDEIHCGYKGEYEFASLEHFLTSWPRRKPLEIAGLAVERLLDGQIKIGCQTMDESVLNEIKEIFANL